MDAIGELMILGLVIIAIIGVYFVLSCMVPVVADAPPGTEPERVLSPGRLLFGLLCLGVAGGAVYFLLSGLGGVASH